MIIEKLSENATMFTAYTKKLYTMPLPSDISSEFIKEAFGRTNSINVKYIGRPMRINEGAITYYVEDGGFARAFIKGLVEDAKKKLKEKEDEKAKSKAKIEYDPDLSELPVE